MNTFQMKKHIVSGALDEKIAYVYGEGREVGLYSVAGRSELSGKYTDHNHGGFAGTIQAFVPTSEAEGFRTLMDSVFGEGKCIVLRIRPVGKTCIA